MFGSLGSSLSGGVGILIPLAEFGPSLFLILSPVLSFVDGVPNDLESLSSDPPIPPGLLGLVGL